MLLLGVGFLLTLPLLLLSTPEEKQRLTQSTTTMRIVEYQIGLQDVSEDERKAFRKLLQKEPLALIEQPKRDAWLLSVRPEIMSFGVSEHEAESIARWVWLYAHSHNLDPSLLLALIAIESRFDAYATSSVGAQGLMQVMPFWKKELGSKTDNLFDVATNIRYGASILDHYMKRYRSPKKALAAYNGSRGREKYPNKVFSQMKRFE